MSQTPPSAADDIAAMLIGRTEGSTERTARISAAATMFAAGLADPRMKIEIEVTARRRAAL